MADAPRSRERVTMRTTVEDALCLYGRLPNAADDLAWTPPWRRRRRSQLRFEASRLFGHLGEAVIDHDAEIVLSAGPRSPLATTYHEYVAERDNDASIDQRED